MLFLNFVHMRIVVFSAYFISIVTYLYKRNSLLFQENIYQNKLIENVAIILISLHNRNHFSFCTNGIFFIRKFRYCLLGFYLHRFYLKEKRHTKITNSTILCINILGNVSFFEKKIRPKTQNKF